MEDLKAIWHILEHTGILTAADVAEVKRNLITAGLIYGYIWWRNKKELAEIKSSMKLLQKAVLVTESTLFKIQNTLSDVQSGFEKIKNGLEHLAQSLLAVKKDDHESATMLSKRIDEQAHKQHTLEILMTRLNTRTTIVETVTGIVPKTEGDSDV